MTTECDEPQRNLLLPRRDAPIHGCFEVPTSKSLTNRALVAAAVAGGGHLTAPLDCEDTRLLAAALAEAGWDLEWSDGRIVVGGHTAPADRRRVVLGNSGTGVRLILGLLAVTPGEWIVDGSDRLRQRPMRPLLDALAELGVRLRCVDGQLPVELDGDILDGGSVTIRPEVSSQFVSALLLAAPATRRGLRLEVQGTVPSQPYLELTRVVLESFGAEVDRDAEGRRWTVSGGGLRPTRYRIEGDWSAAAFGLATAATMAGEVEVGDLDPDSSQGDQAVASILAAAGLALRWEGRRIVVAGPRTGPIRADLVDAPDLFPALIVAASIGQPGSRLTGLQHLRHKESDRLTVMVDNLERLGARFRGSGTELEVVETVHRRVHDPIDVTAAADHRVAMAMAIASLAAGPLRLDDPSVVDKSFPTFWRSWQRLLSGSSQDDRPS